MHVETALLHTSLPTSQYACRRDSLRAQQIVESQAVGRKICLNSQYKQPGDEPQAGEGREE